MTKAELFALLADCPDDMPLLVAGYEGGMTPLSIIDAVQVVQVNLVETEDYYGEYLLSKTGDSLSAMVLSGNAPSDFRWSRPTDLDYAKFQEHR